MIQILPHPLAEIADIERKHGLQVFHALHRGGFRLACGVSPGLRHFIPAEAIGITFIFPRGASQLGKFALERLILIASIELPLKVCNMRMIGAIAEPLVKHPQEHLQDGIFFIFSISTTVDVKKDHLGLAIHRCVNVTVELVVADLLFEKIDSFFALVSMNGSLITQQIREDLDKVRFTGAKVTGDPDTNLASHAGIIRMGDARQIGFEEMT